MTWTVHGSINRKQPPIQKSPLADPPDLEVPAGFLVPPPHRLRLHELPLLLVESLQPGPDCLHLVPLVLGGLLQPVGQTAFGPSRYLDGCVLLLVLGLLRSIQHFHPL